MNLVIWVSIVNYMKRLESWLLKFMGHMKGHFISFILVGKVIAKLFDPYFSVNSIMVIPHEKVNSCPREISMRYKRFLLGRFYSG